MRMSPRARFWIAHYEPIADVIVAHPDEPCVRTFLLDQTLPKVNLPTSQK